MLNYYLIKKNNSKVLFNSFLHLTEAFYDDHHYYITDNCRIRTEKYGDVWNIYYRGDMGKPINNSYDLLAKRLKLVTDDFYYTKRPPPEHKKYWVYLHIIWAFHTFKQKEKL